MKEKREHLQFQVAVTSISTGSLTNTEFRLNITEKHAAIRCLIAFQLMCLLHRIVWLDCNSSCFSRGATIVSNGRLLDFCSINVKSTDYAMTLINADM